MQQQDGSADLFANFAGIMIIVVALMMSDVKVKESLVDIQNSSTPIKQHSMMPDKRRLSLLEVAYRAKAPLFYWKASTTSRKRTFNRYADLRKARDAVHPDGIRLRVDDRIPSGIFKKILADASNLDIPVYESMPSN